MSSELDMESTAKRKTLSDPDAGSPIENEIANYRAIHPLAVLAFLAGVVGIFSFTGYLFLGFAIAAVLLGALAVSRIQAAPDIYAGAALAKIGLAIGLICGLSSVTMDFVWHWQAKASAQRFAKEYTEILGQQSLKSALWYRLDPDNRARTDPESFFDSFQNQSSSGDPTAYESMAGPINQVHNALKSAGANPSLKFEEIETAGFQDLDAYAYARVILQPGAPTAAAEEEKDHDHAKDEDHGHEHASSSPPQLTEPTHLLLTIKGNSKGGKYSWWVTDITYPYQSRTKRPTTTIDHGHSHGS